MWDHKDVHPRQTLEELHGAFSAEGVEVFENFVTDQEVRRTGIFQLGDVPPRYKDCQVETATFTLGEILVAELVPFSTLDRFLDNI